MENHAFILRIPPHTAERVRAAMKSGVKSEGIRTCVEKQDVYGLKGSSLLEHVWGLDGTWGSSSCTGDAEDLLESVYPEFVSDIRADLEQRESVRGGDAEDGWSVAYRHVSDDKYVVRIDRSEFHATMVTLPTVVEAHLLSEKSKQDGGADSTAGKSELKSVARVTRMLIVHATPASQPRKDIPRGEYDMVGNWKHGVTPPMERVLTERFARTSPKVMREELGVSMEQVLRAEEELNRYTRMVSAKRMSDRGKTKDVKRTIFSREDIVQMPGWMVYLMRHKGDRHQFTVEVKGASVSRSLELEMMKLMKKAKDHFDEQGRRRDMIAATDQMWKERFKQVSHPRRQASE